MQTAEQQRTSFTNDRQHRTSQTVMHLCTEYVILNFIEIFSQYQSKQLSFWLHTFLDEIKYRIRKPKAVEKHQKS